MTPEQQYKEAFETLYSLCETNGWGDPFSYARSREIHMATTLGHQIADDYSGADAKGVLLSGVAKGGPAAKAGVQGGDIIVGLGSKKIENIYDYTEAISSLKPDKKVAIAVIRKNKKVTLEITPKAR